MATTPADCLKCCGAFQLSTDIATRDACWCVRAGRQLVFNLSSNSFTCNSPLKRANCFTTGPFANPNEAQASIKETGCCERLRNRTLTQERDAVTRHPTAAVTSTVHFARLALKVIVVNSAILLSIGLASWSSAPLPDFSLCSFQLSGLKPSPSWLDSLSDSMRSAKCLGVTVAMMAGCRLHGA